MIKKCTHCRQGCQTWNIVNYKSNTIGQEKAEKRNSLI